MFLNRQPTDKLGQILRRRGALQAGGAVKIGILRNPKSLTMTATVPASDAPPRRPTAFTRRPRTGRLTPLAAAGKLRVSGDPLFEDEALLYCHIGRIFRVAAAPAAQPFGTE